MRLNARRAYSVDLDRVLILIDPNLKEVSILIARIRKAVIAGVGAGLAAGIGALAESAAQGDITEAAVSRAIGLGVAAAVSVGWATWKVRNAPAVSR